MSEFAATTLSLTLVPGTWQEVLARLQTYLQGQHNPPTSLRRDGQLLTVDIGKQRILRRRPIDLWQPLAPASEDIQYWRSVTVEAWFDTIAVMVDFSVHEIAEQQTGVELWFPTRVHEGVFCYDLARREFNPAAKSQLIRMFIAVAKALGAAGFGYRSAKEDSLFGPLTIELLRDYLEIEGRWFERKHELPLKVAGLDTTYIEDTQFKYHRDSQPMYYRQNGFYIFDMLWPD